MRKLAEVEEAKAIMIEAVNWSVMKWLTEKKKVRHMADKANAALNELEKEVKASWSDELKAAYQALSGDSGRGHHSSGKHGTIDPQLAALAQKIKEADDEAYRSHMDAENTFDEAERKLSTSLAREGTRKAIESWDLHEKAIRKAEAAVRSTAA